MNKTYLTKSTPACPMIPLLYIAVPTASAAPRMAACGTLLCGKEQP